MSPPVLEGYETQRWLADGRTVVAVCRMTFGKGRLIIGNRWAVEDGWCYETLAGALAAFAAWEPDKTEEPEGWFRHPLTGRRRPDGDAAREHVYW